MDKISLKYKLSELENSVLEYKSRDIIAGTNKQIIEELSKDIENKIKESPCKIYFIGVEDNGDMCPISSSRLKSDRINNIRDSLQNLTCIENVYAFPIFINDYGILVLILLRK